MPKSLVQVYAPQVLTDIKGQDFPVSYFKSVVAYPEKAIRNYVILGPYGTGKTSLCRCFAADLLGPGYRETPNFLEIDSFQISDRETMEALKDYIFQEVPGWKIVVLDEWHLVPKDVQAGLLKSIEDCTSPIFFFFVSTERQGILDTIFSRSIDFTLSKFSRPVLETMLDDVCAHEFIEISPELREALVFRSYGHARNLLNQLDFARQMGEEAYLASTRDVVGLVTELFTSPSKDVVDRLSVFPYPYVQESIDFFIHEKLIRGRELYQDVAINNIFAQYLRLKRFVQNENDFFSFLHVLAAFLGTMRAQHARS